MSELEIIYQDEYYVAINKPNGLLVHRTKIAEEKEFFAVQMLRNQIGMKVSPVHRLDRKTSGVLVFGLSSEATKLLAKQFTERTTEKEYWAIVRGFAPENGVIDKPLKSEKGNLQIAETHFKTHQNFTLPIPMGKYPTCRYSLVEIRPKTGRMHQIRRHFNHINHPIVGDYKHGDYRHNHLFIKEFEAPEMFLHASELSFEHPFFNKKMTIKADFQKPFLKMKERFEWV
jgi:tRNA pseudouridine65 synthase